MNSAKKRALSTTSKRPASRLRARAEHLLTEVPRRISVMPEENKPDLVHELQVHQVELEMQNEELRRVQLQLEASRDRYAELYDFAPVGYLTLDAEGTIHEANLTAATLLGANRENLVLKKLSRFIARESQDTFYLHRHQVLTTGARQSCELEMRRQDGSALIAALESRASESGLPTRWQVTLADITAIHRGREQRLRDLSSLPEENPLPVMRICDAGILRYANEPSAPFLAAWRCGVDESVPKEWLEIVRSVLERGTIDQREMTIGGRVFECTLAPFKERGYVNLYARDITQRREAEAALREMHAQLETRVRKRTAQLEKTNRALREREQELSDFFEQSPLGLLWVGPDGRVLRVNHSQLELLGLNASDEMLGRDVAEFFMDQEIVTDLVWEGETVQDHRARLRQKDGSIKHVLVDANGFRMDNRLIHARWFVRDITRRVELEREILNVSEREQTRLSQDLHDDLCQQLTGIQFLCDTLAGELRSQSATGAAQAKEIAQMVRNALTQTREMARGLSPVSMDAEGLTDALQQLASRIERVFHRECVFRCAKPVKVSNHLVGTHLYRIAQEAISNAIRHGKARRIEIVLTPRGNDLILGIKDDGIGFPKKPRKQKGMGLRIMQYRAGVISGSLLVQRKPTGGTEVVCTVSDGLLPANRKTKK